MNVHIKNITKDLELLLKRNDQNSGAKALLVYSFQKKDIVDKCDIIMSSKWNKKFPRHDRKIHLVAAGAGRTTSAARQADWI